MKLIKENIQDLLLEMNSSKALFFGGTSEIALEISKKLKKYYDITSFSRSISANKNYTKEIKIDFNKKIFPKKKINKNLKSKFSLVVFFQAYQPKYNKNFYDLKYNFINEVINVNAIFSIKIITYLIKKKFLKKNCKIVFFSSRSGSIFERGKFNYHKPGGNNLYRASKAILNSFVKNISYEYNSLDHIFIAYDPGWAKTKSSGGMRKGLSKKIVSKKFLQNILKFKKKHSGKFIDLNFKIIPW